MVDKVDEMPRMGLNLVNGDSSRYSVFAVIALLLLSTISVDAQTIPARIPSASIDYVPSTMPKDALSTQGYLAQPLWSGFIENRGQIKDADVLFYINTAQGRLSLLEGGILVTLTGRNPSGAKSGLFNVPDVSFNPNMGSMATASKDPMNVLNVLLAFDGARQVRPTGRVILPGYTNFIMGNDHSKWTSMVATYRMVVYEGLYNGIDLVCQIGPEGIKYEFHLLPNTDPDDIAFHVQGGSVRKTADDRSIVIETILGDIFDSGLDIHYQDDPDVKVDGSFRIDEGMRYGFDVGRYEKDRSIIIDPYIYSTLFGGSSLDDGYSISVDEVGDVYIGGMTASLDLPTSPAAFQEKHSGFIHPYNYADVFVAKLGSKGRTLEFSTYLGAFGSYDWLMDMKVDNDGNVYICGHTLSGDFPTTEGAFQTYHNNMNSIGFVSKLSRDGTKMVYSTLLGTQDSSDYACGLDVDKEGYAYVVGYTGSQQFPTTPGAYQTTSEGGSAFISKLDRTGSSLVYSTFLGGSDSDAVFDVALDGNGSIFVTGETRSRDFPITHDLLERHPNGMNDVFVSKIGKDGDELEYSIVFGSEGEDCGKGIAIDEKGYLYITGITPAEDFPTTEGAAQSKYGGGDFDRFVMKINLGNNSTVYSSYLGGSESEWVPFYMHGVSIDVDSEGNAYLVGYTASSDFPVTTNAHQPSFGGGGWDAFITVIGRDGRSFVHSTYLGGSAEDMGYGIDLDNRSVTFITGYTYSREFPTSPDAYQRTHDAEFRDAFIMSFDFKSPIADAGPDLTIDQHEAVQFDGTGSMDNLGIDNWTWSFNDGRGACALYGSGPSHTFHEAGTFTVSLNVTDSSGNWAVDRMNVTVRDSTRPFADAGPDISIDQFETAVFDGSSSGDNVGIVNATWRFEYGGKQIQLEGINASFKFDVAGMFLVELIVSDAAGNQASDVLEVWVRDVTSPTANAGPDLSIDQHQTVTFNGTASSDNVAILDWVWTFKYNWTQVKLYGPNPEFIFHRAGVYMVTLEVFDAEGNRGIDEVIITVRDRTPPVANAGPDMVVRQGERVPLNGSGSRDDDRIVRWDWTFEYREILVEITGETQFFVFKDSGAYEITLEVRDPAGNVGRDTLMVTVLDITPPQAEAGPDMKVEQGQLTSFDGSGSDDDVGIVNWSWSFEDGTDSIRLGGPRASHIFQSTGNHPVLLNVTDRAGNWATDIVMVRVIDAMNPIADAGGNITIREGETVEFNGSNSSDNLAIYSFSWFFEYGDSPISLNGEKVNLTFMMPGEYKVHLMVRDAAGNSGTDTLSVTVLPLDDGKPHAPEKRTDLFSLWFLLLGILILLASIIYIRYRKRA